MDVLAKEDLRSLSEKQEGPCVSIFTPTHRGADTQQDLIRFKNLLREAEERLIAAGVRATEARQLLEPAQGLLPDALFWQHQGDGLALFISRNLFHHYRVPLHLEELVVVANRFHLRPLLPLLSGDEQFYILALSQNEVRLFQCTRHSTSEVELTDVPRNLDEALQFDTPERQLQFHTGTPAGTGKRSAMFHGHGGAGEDIKENLRQFCHRIDAGLHGLLREERAPLVLAAVDYLHPIYREANTYPHLLDRGSIGNPDRLSAEELCQQAWPIVEPSFLEPQRAAADHYRQLIGTDRASNDIREIVPAAHYGRIESLFVALGIQQWGTFDPDSGTVVMHKEADPGTEDLLDLAAIRTLLNDGAVYAVEPNAMPPDTSAAAVFRY